MLKKLYREIRYRIALHRAEKARAAWHAKHPRRAHGFTLLELMISVAIVGLLVAIALPAYAAFTTRSQASEGIRMADSLEASVVDSFQSNGVLPGTNVAAGVTSNVGKYVTATAINNGTITVTFGNQASPGLSGTVMTLYPYLTSDGVTIGWICAYASATVPSGWTVPPNDGTGSAAVASNTPAQFLPRSCRSGG